MKKETKKGSTVRKGARKKFIGWSHSRWIIKIPPRPGVYFVLFAVRRHKINKNPSTPVRVIQAYRYNRNSETRDRQNREQLLRTIDIAYGKQSNVDIPNRASRQNYCDRRFYLLYGPGDEGPCQKARQYALGTSDQINPFLIFPPAENESSLTSEKLSRRLCRKY